MVGKNYTSRSLRIWSSCTCSVKSEAEKKSSASVDMPELKPSKCLYNKKSAYYVMREVCDYETHQMIELKRRLQDKLADYTYEELLDLERKVDPSLGYLQLFFKRAITAKMSTELQIGLELLG